MIRTLTTVLLWLVINEGQQPQLTHWCVMHPDQRAASAILCPICRMPMVPIPPMKVGEYRIDVAPLRTARAAGLTGVRLTLREPTGAAVTAVDTVHEKPLHVFIVSHDFGFFRHVHADSMKDGVAEVRTVIPPGEYMLIADFVPTGGVPQLVHRTLLSPGVKPAPARLPAAGIGGGVRARAVSNALQVGGETKVRIVLTGEKDGRPILDLEPYLGAAAHLLLVNESLTESVHAHAAEWTAVEPVLSFDITVLRAGTWRAFLQFQRAGAVATVPMSFLGR